MNSAVVTRVQIGFSLALVVLLSIGGSAILIHSQIMSRFATGLCSGLGVLGVILWLAGRAEISAETQAENPLAPLRTARHWGLLLTLSACLIYLHVTYRRLHAQVPAAAAPVARVVPKPVTFPPLKLQSLVYQGAHSSAIINGKVVCVGEDVGLVEVVGIEPDRVKVALQGQTNVLLLGDASRPTTPSVTK